MQTLITFLVLTCAVAYAAWRIYDSLRHGGNPCRGCKLAEHCGKRTKSSVGCADKQLRR